MTKKQSAVFVRSIKERWLGTRQTCTLWWKARTLRERLLMSLALTIAAFSLIWLLMVKPSLAVIRQADAALPALRTQVAELEAIAQEITVLKQQGSGSMDPALFDQALNASVMRAGLTSSLQLETSGSGSDGPREVIVQRASSRALMRWLASASGQVQFKIVHLALVRASKGGRDLPGYVSGRLILLPVVRGLP
jgi:general secretion pathway protein M